MAILKSFDRTQPELPEEVIQRILSLIPIKDGYRASCLSKTWLNAWQTRPILDFDEDFYYLNPRNSQREGFLNYENRALQRYREQKIGIEKFKLRFRTTVVSEWIQVALKNGVKKLELVGYCNDFVLPEVIFEAKSSLGLTVEGIRYSWLKLPESMIQCQYVKYLHLRFLRLNNSNWQRIISSCPMIEDLMIWDCTGIDSFKVTKLSKLKKFKLINCTVDCDKSKTIEVEVPSLEFLHCSRFLQLSMNASQNLKQLKLCRVGIKDEFFLDFNYRFPHLEDLTIHSCPSLERIRMSSASLRKMELDILHSGNFLQELQINAPSLTSFKYTGNLIHNVSFTSDHSSHCFSHIDLGRPSLESTLFFVNLKEFLKNFSQSTIHLCLDPCFNIRDDGIIFDVKKAMCLDSSVAVQVHELIIPALVPEKFLDGVFWSCHPETIRRIASSSSKCCSILAEYSSLSI